MSQATTAATTNATLLDWVDRVAELTKAADVHWCDGSAEEYDQLCQTLIEAGTFETRVDISAEQGFDCEVSEGVLTCH